MPRWWILKWASFLYFDNVLLLHNYNLKWPSISIFNGKILHNSQLLATYNCHYGLVTKWFPFNSNQDCLNYKALGKSRKYIPSIKVIYLSWWTKFSWIKKNWIMKQFQLWFHNFLTGLFFSFSCNIHAMKTIFLDYNPSMYPSIIYEFW